MSTFILVHGAWQSAGTWDLLTPLPEKQGHRVITPVLSGLGTDQDLLSPNITLQQHVEDVLLELSRFPDQLILVGHSYAGMIISAVMGKGCWTYFLLGLAPIFATLPESREMVGGYRAAKTNLISGD